MSLSFLWSYSAMDDGVSSQEATESRHGTHLFD